jgi:hypothetical protein
LNLTALKTGCPAPGSWNQTFSFTKPVLFRTKNSSQLL